MQPKVVQYFIALTFCCISLNAAAQTSIDSTITAIQNIPGKSLDYIDKKYSKLSNELQKQNEKLLISMQDKEASLRKKLQGIDSTKAKELFETSEAKYQQLQSKVQGSVDNATSKLKEYIPGLDSTNMALKFLSQPDAAALTTDKLNQLSSVTGSVQELEGRLQQANEIQSFIRQREALLKTALENTGLGKELLGINREVFYYQQRLSEYKELLNDKKKLEAQLLATMRELPAFQRFMKKYSYLALLFPQPENYGTPAALAGLQTRTSVQGMINQRLGTGGAGGMNPQQYMSQQLQQGQAKMNELKEKLNQLGNSGGSSDMTMPDFKPDNQHTKSFLQRLEYGFNIQSQHSTNWLPATSDIALTLGYKFNDKVSFGTGVSYKIGWGNGWNDFKISSQGVGLRSYLDIKARGSLWISGGYEFNYMQEFSKFDDIKNIDVWQRSALMGLTKKIKIGKKRETRIQFLYDFLAADQLPQASPFKFRIGYNF